MVLPLLKLGTLALKTLSKPIAGRLKQQAGLHPRFRQLIINIAQVAGAAVIFEWHRSSWSDSKKEEIRKQELEVMRLRDEEFKREVEFLKKKLEEVEQLARSQGLAGVFSLKNATASATADQEKAAKAA